MKADWRTLPCPACGGYGVVSLYSSEDFEGPGECDSCKGMGGLWIRPTGHCFMWPGGPALGMWDREAYGRATPVGFDEGRERWERGAMSEGGDPFLEPGAEELDAEAV